jgi:hypothetical protein
MVRISTVFLLLFACGPVPDFTASRPLTESAQELSGQVAVIGASASDGFRLSVGLADALAALVGNERLELADFSASGMFLGPRGQGARQVDQALALEPALVMAVDFLFWFGYGLVVEESDRLELFEDGIRLLDSFDCPLVVARYPDMSPAIGRMLIPGQVPRAATLELLNRRLVEWAEERGDVLIVPLDTLLDKMRSDRPISVGGRTWPAGSTQALLQDDRLHPTLEGELVLAQLVLDALANAGLRGAATSDWDSALVKLRGLSDSR